MLTRTLRGFGFFMGRGTTVNEECRFTNALNQWVFGQGSATWERPEGVDAVLGDVDLSDLISDYLSGVINGPSSVGYLGVLRWLRYRSMFRIAEPWGWKDPRNTYTLPLWLRVFPNAKVLHIMRHGVDVAESLRLRRQAAAARAAQRYRRGRWLYVNNPLAPKRSGFAHSIRVGGLDGGLELWEAYTARAQEHVQRLDQRALELRYESLLEDPLPNLERVLEFCGLDAPEKSLREEAAKFRSDRAYAHRGDSALNEYARLVSARLERFGY